MNETPDMAAEAERWKRRLEQHLDVLSADARAQIVWLDGIFDGTPWQEVDELGLEFDDIWSSGRVVHADTLPETVREHLVALDRALDEMSGRENEVMWTPSALESRPEWTRIRNLATAARDALRTE